jgi:hypothetical protein
MLCLKTTVFLQVAEIPFTNVGLEKGVISRQETHTVRCPAAEIHRIKTRNAPRATTKTRSGRAAARNG